MLPCHLADTCPKLLASTCHQPQLSGNQSVRPSHHDPDPGQGHEIKQSSDTSQEELLTDEQQRLTKAQPGIHNCGPKMCANKINKMIGILRAL